MRISISYDPPFQISLEGGGGGEVDTNIRYETLCRRRRSM